MIVCPKCLWAVPLREALAYHGYHEDCRVDGEGEYAGDNGGVPRNQTAGCRVVRAAGQQVRIGQTATDESNR